MDNKHPEATKIDFASIISDFLFRWRKSIFIVIALLVAGLITYGVLTALSKQRLQKSARAVYELRQGFDAWKEAHPEDLLTATKSLKEQGSNELELDEESQKKAEQSEQDLNALLDENASSTNKTRKAWAYWIQALKAQHLQDNALMQKALEELIALDDATLHNLAQLHLAGLLYAEEKPKAALAIWQTLAEREDPIPEQIIASIYLANYFAREAGNDAEAIRYWQQVQSLGEELLQNNGLEDDASFLGGQNLITGNFRSALQQWKAMAENQLLFLQSEKIQLAANRYDAEAVGPESDEAEFDKAESASSDSVSFDVPNLLSN